MSKTMIITTVAYTLLTIMLTVALLAHPYSIANAKKLTSANHISSSHTTNCDGDVCKMSACTNDNCHPSTTGSIDPSTTDATDS